MTLNGLLERAGLRKPAAVPKAAVAPAFHSQARPTYATHLTGNALLPRDVSFSLLRQFHRSVPVMGRAIDILAGFVGCPCIESDNEALAEECEAWCRSVRFGQVGMGFASFLRDHLGQALLYGYGVGEMTPTPRRDDVEALWSYLSPSFGFRTEQNGEFRIVQSQGFGEEVVLNPATALLTVPYSEGCSPNGRSLFFSSLTFAQGWMDIAHAYRSMWKRNGIPTFHVNWSPSGELDDPTGAVASAIATEMGTAWNQGRKSQAVDGVAEDFFSSGNTTVQVIGADGAIIDITISKRAMVEEIVAATGIPAWMLGYSWSTTERLSTQQADMLLATIDIYRSALLATVEKVFNTRLLLTARAGQWKLRWNDVNLQDLLQTARADLVTQQARAARQSVGRQLWTDGVWTQAQYAEDLTGLPAVAVGMSEPPSMAPEPVGPESGGGGGGGEEQNSLKRALEWERSLPPLREMLPEYEGTFAACNGRH